MYLTRFYRSSMEAKVCSRCETPKPLNCYHKSPHSKTGVHAYCKVCTTTYNRERYQRDPKKAAALRREWNLNNKERSQKTKRSYSLRNLYGITLDQYNALLSQQDNRCAICMSTSTKRKTCPNLLVDHCHATGKVRGLLCSTCNSAIGMLEESEQSLTNAISYLKKHK